MRYDIGPFRIKFLTTYLMHHAGFQVYAEFITNAIETGT